MTTRKVIENQRLGDQSDAKRPNHGQRPFPSDEKDVRDRILELIGLDSGAAFSRLTGIPESSLRSYLTKGTKPGMEHLVAMAQAKGVTIDWLATGREPRLRADIEGIDNARLQVAVSAVEEGLQKARKQVPPDRHAELICAAYDLTKRMDRAEIVHLITVLGG